MILPPGEASERASGASEKNRLAALKRYEILDTPPEQAFDRITGLAVKLLGVPVGITGFLDETRHWFKARVGVDMTETTRAGSFCHHTLLQDGVLVVPDTTRDERFADLPVVKHGPVRFYAGVPLTTPDGYKVGTLCVLDTEPREGLNDLQVQVLEDLAHLLVDELELRLSAERLRRERDRSERLKAELESFFALSVDLFCIATPDGVFTHTNPAWQKVLGFSAAELSSQPFMAFVHPEDREATSQAMQVLSDGRTVQGFENRYRTKSGNYRWFSWSAHTNRADKHIYSVARDVTERKQVEGELQRTAERLAETLESISDVFLSFDTQWRFTYLNAQGEAFLNKSRAALLGQNVWKAFPELAGYLFYENCHEAASSGQPLAFEEHYPPLGVWFEVHLYPNREGLSVYFKDVTARKQAEALQREMQDELERRIESRTTELQRLNDQLQFDAFHDALTGLANRALLLDRLEQTIKRQRRRPTGGYAVLVLGLDRFKLVNDSLGHGAGNALLVGLGERLEACVRPGDTVARLSGDEFALLLDNIDAPEEATRTAERVQFELAKPFEEVGQTLYTSASIGIVSNETEHDSAEAALRDADLAMHRAKASGKARHQVFASEMRERAAGLLTLENDLRKAVAQGEFRVFYQPILRLADGRVSGFEALVRWEHPKHGLVSPAEFIPIAEETGIILDLDRFVLREACRQLKVWHATLGEATLTVSVNLSGQQFADPALVEVVKEVLAQTNFDPRLLKLEITEGVLMKRADVAVEILQQLRSLGTQIYLDDFGTGYSSLSYLQCFSVDTLKIDRAFVQQMVQSPESEALVTTIIAMAKNLKLNVVAEGIETEAQLLRLRMLGCALGQGYLFAKPLRSAEVPAFLALARPSLGAAASQDAVVGLA